MIIQATAPAAGFRRQTQQTARSHDRRFLQISVEVSIFTEGTSPELLHTLFGFYLHQSTASIN